MDVYFGVMSCDPLVLNKTSGIAFAETPVSCSVYSACSIVSPVLKLRYSSTLLSYNYFYIPEWGRYYFMETPEVQPGEIAIIRGSEDYLYSNLSEIQALECDIVRNEYAHNFDKEVNGKYIQDNEMTKSGRSYIRTRLFTGNDANVFNMNVSSKHCYLLTVIGGVNNSSQGGNDQ